MLANVEVSLVEVVVDVPAKRPELPPAVNDGVQVTKPEKQVLVEVAVLTVALPHVFLQSSQVPLDLRLHAQRLLQGNLDTRLQQELRTLVLRQGQPESKLVVTALQGELLDVGDPARFQLQLLDKHPGALPHGHPQRVFKPLALAIRADNVDQLSLVFQFGVVLLKFRIHVY